MMKCIICRKDTQKKDFSDEHVIPDAIGGVYHIYKVCKKCNSYLGSNIDSKLVNNYLTSLFRYSLNIKGKTGKVPNPFDGTHILENDNESKVKILFDDNNKPIPYLLPKVTKKSLDDRIEINLSLDSIDQNKEDVILEKIFKREKIDKDKLIIKKEPIISTFKPKIKMEKIVDIKEFKIGLLKIAYEFAVDSIEEYFEDDKAIEISNFLLNPDFDKIDKYFIGNGLDRKIFEPFDFLFDLNKKRHLLFLISTREFGFICFISLYNLFNIVVVLSKSEYLINNMIIVSNDLENSTFEKIDLFGVYKKISKESIKFEWYFENQKDYDEFLGLSKSGKLEYYKIGDKLPFFDKLYKIKYNSLNHLIENYIDIEYFKNFENGLNTKNLIELKEILYLKILPINKYFQVIAVSVENTIQSKY